MRHLLSEVYTLPLVRLIRNVSLWGGRLAALIVLPLIFAMVFEVFSRYGLHRPTAWAFELSYMMMGSIFVLGASYALAINAHVNVDFIHNILPKRVVAVIDLVGYAVLCGLATWLAIYLGNYAMEGYRSGEGSGLSAWNPQVWPYRSILCFGFTLFALQTFGKTLENLLTALGVAGDEA